MNKEELIKQIKDILKEEISITQSGYMNGNADLEGRDECAERLANFIFANFYVMRSACDHDRHYSEIDGFAYCNKCGVVMP